MRYSVVNVAIRATLGPDERSRLDVIVTIDAHNANSDAEKS